MRSESDWITTTIDAGLLRGAVDLERTEQGVQPNIDGQLAMAEAQLPLSPAWS